MTNPSSEFEVSQTAENVPVTLPANDAAKTAGSGIIDSDFVGTAATPIYTFSGGSHGGQPVVTCDQCGSMLQRDSENQHNVWHGLINGVLRYNGIQA